MIQAQNAMQTEMLLALMLLAALVGFLIDRLLMVVTKPVIAWKFEQ